MSYIEVFGGEAPSLSGHGAPPTWQETKRAFISKTALRHDVVGGRSHTVTWGSQTPPGQPPQTGVES